ncbi:MAG: exodeoxyribonuclease III [Victivallales bacterium]|nr:exodeoxyribonuclease III [Victivallales bacterium]MCF7889566.1 exodeoxyribonuclease III [Victivallales bacterium]
MKKIYSWNVNGVRACVRKGMLDWINTAKPYIFALQETKAREEQLSQNVKEAEGYKSYWFSAERKGYSGVALYTREEPESIENLGIEKFDIEGRTQIARYPDFILINCYFPNSQEGGARLYYKLDFCDAVLEKCNQFVAEGKNILLCGDYNIAHTPIDLKNPKSNENNAGYLPEEREWMTKFLSNGYVDSFRKFHPGETGHYSWWSYRFKARERNAGWRIDYHCINKDFEPAVTGADIHSDVTGSDHCPVSISLDF